MRVSTALVTALLSLAAGVSATPDLSQRDVDFKTFFCTAEPGSGKPVPSANFCKAAGGAPLPSAGLCCVREDGGKVLEALANGCHDNKFILETNNATCSP